MDAAPDPKNTLSATAVAGAFIWSMRHVLKAGIMSGDPRNRNRLRRAYIESLFCMISAGIGGYTVAPAIAKWRHITAPEGLTLMGTLFGLIFWAAVPAIAALGEKVLPPWLARIVGLGGAEIVEEEHKP